MTPRILAWRAPDKDVTLFSATMAGRWVSMVVPDARLASQDGPAIGRHTCQVILAQLLIDVYGDPED